MRYLGCNAALGAAICFAVTFWSASADPAPTPGNAPATTPGTVATATPGETDKPAGDKAQTVETPDRAGDPSKSDILAHGSSQLMVELLPETAWQPHGGHVRFKVFNKVGASPSPLRDLQLTVSFGWPGLIYTSADTPVTQTFFNSTQLRVIDRQDAFTVYETSFPDALWDKKIAPHFWDPLFDKVRVWRGKPVHVYDGLGAVPMVHMRVVGKSLNSPASQPDPNQLDAILSVGVSNQVAVGITTLLLLGFAWWLLHRWATQRHIRGNPVLRLITNKHGYASLSQLQIVLWTAVIGAGLCYVMLLSGSLIDVPEQELALLGIAGFSALSAAFRAKQNQKKAAEAAGTQGTSDSAAAAAATPDTQSAAAATNAVPPADEKKRPRTPEWADLVVWDGNGQLDITRVQMLLFTVLAAGFVALKIIDDNALPTIPDGIVLLMGLTNGVYVGGKYVTSGS